MEFRARLEGGSLLTVAPRRSARALESFALARRCQAGLLGCLPVSSYPQVLGPGAISNKKLSFLEAYMALNRSTLGGVG